jgi:EAL domain-containing protein (putative c-di-GMP-specific phosphodiesterase class I)
MIVRSTIELGHNMGMHVVAEGVENMQIVAQLKTLGCDMVQGYVYSKPLPPAAFIDWIQQFNAAENQTAEPLRDA